MVKREEVALALNIVNIARVLIETQVGFLRSAYTDTTYGEEERQAYDTDQHRGFRIADIRRDLDYVQDLLRELEALETQGAAVAPLAGTD